MGRFAEKYAKEWKQAIVIAMVDHDLTPKQAVAAAAEGKLPGYPGMTFEMTLSRARQLQTDENRRRRGLELDQAKGDPVQRANQIANRSMAIVEHQIADLERKAKGGKLTNDLVEKGRKLTGWAREARALAAGVAPTKSTGSGARNRNTAKPDPSTPDTNNGNSKLIAQMERDHRTNTNQTGDGDARVSVPRAGAGAGLQG